MARLSALVALWSSVATLVACGGGGEPPLLEPLDDQEVAVGTELVIELEGSDADGDDLSYSFAADVPDIQTRATLTRRPDGVGMFRWTPLAADVGPWFFDFSVSDGSHTTTETIQIEVKSAVGVNSAPIFREPLGTGTTLDLSTESCVDVKVVVEDQDSSSVVISQGAPQIEGALLQSTGNLTGTWHWCPTRDQISADDRYTLILQADDLSNPKTIKNYLIVLRKKPQDDCPGAAPVVTHTPSDVSSLSTLHISAQVSDDVGLKSNPLFYYSTSNPGTTPNLSAMTQVSMTKTSGTMQSGTFQADVPNPVAGLSEGATADLYYVIVAQDNDDAEGDCDHLTQAPSSGSYSMTVTNPGGSGGGALCEPCTADIQCGGASDLCVRVGTGGESFCLQACGSCPTDYTCSASALESVDGASGTQCVPNSNDCSNPGGTTCEDDSYEDNDSRAQAEAQPALPAGSYNLTSCPSGVDDDDEDWFKITITDDTQAGFTLAGGSQTDLDLGLYTTTGGLIESSASLSSNEEITRCLEAGTYYIRVYSWSAEQNDYTLTYTATSQSCGGSCTDDSGEPDDDADHAHVLAFSDVYPGPWDSDTMTICPDNDDWFAIDLLDGDTVTVDLVGDTSADLDLHFIDPDLVDLTPCTEDNPDTCSPDNGQSAGPDEHYEFTLNDTDCYVECTHYIVVHGWQGATNDYLLSVQLSY